MKAKKKDKKDTKKSKKSKLREKALSPKFGKPQDNFDDAATQAHKRMEVFEESEE